MGGESNPHLTALLEASEPQVREEAWAAFVREYSPVLLHAARSLGGDRDAVMDRYAFILERLRDQDFRRLRTYAADRRTKLSTWLIVVATRLCLDQHRQRYGRSRGTDDPHETARWERRRALAQLAGAEVDPAELADESSAAADQQVCKGELTAALRDVLAALDPRDRLLLQLRFEEGLSVPRIAALMRFPSAFHAYRRLDVLLRELRLRLKGRGVESPAP
jgi:RNA polymerase sigma factor (sigma-70 family)